MDESPRDCFYYDPLNGFLPMRVWLFAMGWDQPTVGGRQDGGKLVGPPPAYFQELERILTLLTHHPCKDTYPAHYFMKPTSNNVLIKPLPPETVTPGGIIIPETAKQNGLRGEVVAIGPGAWDAPSGTRLPMDSVVGSQVLYDKYAGTEMMVEGVPHLLLNEKNILLHF